MSAAAGGRRYRLALFTKNRTNPAYMGARLGADRVAARLGAMLTHHVPVKPDNVEEQRALLEAVLPERPDAILLVPTHGTALNDILRRIEAAGILLLCAVSRPEVIVRLNPFRPPGSVSTVSVTIVTEALLDPGAASANIERVRGERERLRDGLTAAGWSVGPSMTNFVLVDFGSVERAATVAQGLLSRGLVPRTFPAGHPLADHLRLTVRAPAENDRLLAAAREIEPA